MLINVDLDGVVYPFHNAVTRLAETWITNFKYPSPTLYPNAPVRLPDPAQWNMWDQWGITHQEYEEEFWPWAVEHGVFNQTVPPIHGARYAIEYLMDEGHEIRFVTHKPTQGGMFKHHAIRDCVQWLSWNRISYDSIVFDGQKQRYAADIIIDDNPDYARWSQREAKWNFLFDQPWNRDFDINDELSNGARVYSWPDILDGLANLGLIT